MNEVAKGYGKTPVKALVTLQNSGKSAVCSFTSFNLDLKSRAGAFWFGLRSNLKLQKFPLAGVSQNFVVDPATDFNGFVDCVLVCEQDGQFCPVLWGGTEGKSILIGNMADGFAGGAAWKGGERGAGRAAENGDAAGFEANEPAIAALGPQTAAAAPAANEPKPDYCDYAVAAENYYPPEFDRFAYYSDSNFSHLEPKNTGNAPKGTEAAAVLKDTEAAVLSAPPRTQSAPKAAAAPPKTAKAGAPKTVEMPAEPCEKRETAESGDAPKRPPVYTGGKFYALIKSQIDELFAGYPKEEALCAILENGDFVKVNYDDLGQYYTVGLLYDGEEIKYICYGVPGHYAKDPPPELKGFCQWLPFDAKQPEGEGYWMMYQDAGTGKSVTPV
jgi:hypothetical protein